MPYVVQSEEILKDNVTGHRGDFCNSEMFVGSIS